MLNATVIQYRIFIFNHWCFIKIAMNFEISISQTWDLMIDLIIDTMLDSAVFSRTKCLQYFSSLQNEALVFTHSLFARQRLCIVCDEKLKSRTLSSIILKNYRQNIRVSIHSESVRKMHAENALFRQMRLKLIRNILIHDQTTNCRETTSCFLSLFFSVVFCLLYLKRAVFSVPFI